MTDKVQKIRAEIERRLEDAKAGVRQNQNRVKFGLDSKQDLVIWQHLEGMATQLLTFIDSMQEEPTIPDIVDEHWWEMLGKEPVSEDMWEASKQYALRQVLASTDAEMTEQAYLSLKLFSGFEIAVAHKDGAKWQKQKDKSKVLTEEQCRKIRDDAFELGKDAMKQQMMKEAVECVVECDVYGMIVPKEAVKKAVDNALAQVKEKVKILVIKED